MKKLWFMSQSATATLCLLGIIANHAQAAEEVGMAASEDVDQASESTKAIPQPIKVVPAEPVVVEEVQPQMTPVEPAEHTAWTEKPSLPVTERPKPQITRPETVSKVTSYPVQQETRPRTQYIEDDPVVQAVVHPERSTMTPQEIARLSENDVIRDGRTLHEMVTPTRGDSRADVPPLTREQVAARAAKIRQQREEAVRRLEEARREAAAQTARVNTPRKTPLLSQLEQDLETLRQEAQQVAAQGRQNPIPTPSVETVPTIQEAPLPEIEPMVVQPTPIEFSETSVQPEKAQIPVLPDLATLQKQWQEQLQQRQFTPKLGNLALTLEPDLFEQEFSALASETFEQSLAQTSPSLQSLFGDLDVEQPDLAIADLTPNWEEMLNSLDSIEPLAKAEVSWDTLDAIALDFESEFNLETEFPNLVRSETVLGNNRFSFGFPKSLFFPDQA